MAAVLAMTLLPPMASAQSTEAGTRRNASPTEAMRKMQLVAHCTARTYPEESARLLDAVRGSQAERAQFLTLINKSWPRCRIGSRDVMRFDVAPVRGGISEVRYFERFGRDRPPRAAPELPHDPARFEKPALAVLSLFSGCVVAARPADVHALLLTEAGSPAELAAIRSIQPAFGACLFEGMSADFSRSQLRANFGEALYRQAQAEPAASP
ncbi:MAG: hypothetical protein Q7J32_15965 [Sphingomonadaceae bacterium]|nr:hypothetical protein [Sphingomonadaceae bacterium]